MVCLAVSKPCRATPALPSPSGWRVLQRTRTPQVRTAMSTRWGLSLRLFATLFFLITLLSTPLWSISFQPVSPEELKMTTEPKAPGAPAIILFREVDRDDRGNTAHEDVYFRIKILTE